MSAKSANAPGKPMHPMTRDDDKRALILRLKRVEGQLRGVQQLIEKEAACESVAQQMSAARRALDKAFHVMVGCMLEQQMQIDHGDHGEHGGGAKRTREGVRHVTDILSRYS